MRNFQNLLYIQFISNLFWFFDWEWLMVLLVVGPGECF